jgi:naphthoate synthase
MSPLSEYEDLKVEDIDGVRVITINRPEDGNMLRKQTALDLASTLRDLRERSDLRVAVLTGEGDRFFCLGGEHDATAARDYSAVLPIVDVYELIDAVPKPIIAAVNGFAVGGGNVLHTVCDLTIAAERAVFRQVGPMVGSFDAGFGTWHLEAVIGRKRAKEMWYLNRKYSASQALELGLINEVVPSDQLLDRSLEVAGEIAGRGPGAIAALKAAFSAQHSGAVGQARLAHDLLLAHYLPSEEARELSRAFSEKREPDQTTFNR